MSEFCCSICHGVMAIVNGTYKCLDCGSTRVGAMDGMSGKELEAQNPSIKIMGDDYEIEDYKEIL